MADKKDEKVQEKPQRTPVDQLLLNFLKEHDIILIVDGIDVVVNTVKDFVWVVDRRPRIRVQYRDEMKPKEQATNRNQTQVESELEVKN